ncbi:hypothetical protein LXL04_008163 [Taraxacum kok-saghyz]
MIAGGGSHIHNLMLLLDLVVTIRRHNMFMFINRSLTYVYSCVEMKIEGRTSGNTVATDSPQLQRSDRGSPRTDRIRCTQCECGLVWRGLSLAYDAGLRDLSWQS